MRVVSCFQSIVSGILDESFVDVDLADRDGEPVVFRGGETPDEGPLVHRRHLVEIGGGGAGEVPAFRRMPDIFIGHLPAADVVVPARFEGEFAQPFLPDRLDERLAAGRAAGQLPCFFEARQACAPAHLVQVAQAFGGEGAGVFGFGLRIAQVKFGHADERHRVAACRKGLGGGIVGIGPGNPLFDEIARAGLVFVVDDAVVLLGLAPAAMQREAHTVEFIIWSSTVLSPGAMVYRSSPFVSGSTSIGSPFFDRKVCTALRVGTR